MPSHSAVFMVISRSRSRGVRSRPSTSSEIQLYENFNLELPQESQIATLQLPDVVNRIAHHYQPGQPQAKRESIPLFRIDLAHAQHIGMHQAAGQQFHPSALLTHGAARPAANQALDIELKTWLDEREEARPQPHGDVAMQDRRQQRLP